MSAFHWRTARQIAAKELKDLFASPAAYIVLALFVLAWEYLVFPLFLQIREASLAPFFSALPWFLVLFVPALTMRSIAQEKEQGTLELALTHPVTELELIIGKFLSALVFLLAALGLTLPLLVIGQFFGHFDLGLALSQYLAGLYLAALLTALGLAVSSAFKNSLAALIVAVVASFAWTVAGFGFVTARLPLILAEPLSLISVLTHYEALARGVIDWRDIIFGALALASFLALAVLMLKRAKMSPSLPRYRARRLGVILIIALALTVTLLGSRIPGRLDLTQERLYTLAAGTRTILRSLESPVQLNIYASDRLPSQLFPRLQYVKDLLRDYQRAGQGKIIAAVKNPGADATTLTEAQRYGIQAVQFNIIQQGEFQAKAGYLGLAVIAGDAFEAIPFIDNTDDLEYQLTSAIKKLTAQEKPAVSFLTGLDELSAAADWQILNQELAKQFLVNNLAVSDKDFKIAPETKAVVLAGPKRPPSAAVKGALIDYLKKGGAALVMLEGAAVNPQTLTANANPEAPLDILADFGVSVEKNLVYDLRAAQSITVNTGQVNLLLPYPYWLAAQPASIAGPFSRLTGTVLPWPSAVSADNDKIKAANLKAEPILVTTNFAGVTALADTSASINPTQKLPETNLAKQTLALTLRPADKSAGPRLVVAGNAQFLTDSYLNQLPANLNFGLAALEWLTQGADLSGIRARGTAAQPLVFSRPLDATLYQAGSMVSALVIISGVGLTQLLRRRALKKQIYRL